MTRVVVDTNVFISSFFGGNPKKIIDLWKTGEIILCLSQPIIDEYVEVLRRLGLHNEKELEELLALFAQGFHCVFAGRTPNLLIVNDDPDDNKFIECAVELKSKYIISGDIHLQSVKKYMGIEVHSPREFLEFMRDS